MPVGDCQDAFAHAAAEDGVALERASVPWLNQRGHLGLPPEADSAREVLDTVFRELGGNVAEQATKRLTPLPGDFVHAESGTFIEIDESQHFTSFRLLTLKHYPASWSLGFDLEEYRLLCQEWGPRSDKFHAAKPAVAFGAGGRRRQRAYHDALRDLATPAMGHPPVIRVAATERDGAAAYARHRDRIRSALAHSND